jgi:hypothetical protein
MSFPVWLLVGAVLCLGVIILTIVLIFIALKRGSRVISQGLKQRADEVAQSDDQVNSNDRFARGDLKSAPTPSVAEVSKAACPACGGENSRGAGVCTFCGRKL